MSPLVRASCLLLALLASPQIAHADEGAPLEDLTPLNLDRGWNQPWVHRQRRTPDMALLRVSTNFLERELRTDFTFTDPHGNPKLAGSDFASALLAYPLNRRLMLEVVSNYQWNQIPGAVPVSGAGGAAVVRGQLVDVESSSLSLQFRASAPDSAVGVTQTNLQTTVAGWEDLAAHLPFLDRIGLYYSVLWESLQGPHKSGTRANDLVGALALARTWTEPSTPVVGNLTTFAELLSLVELDGEKPGRATLGVTPGVRFWFLPENSLIAGVDLPLNRAPTYNAVYRLTYILNL